MCSSSARIASSAGPRACRCRARGNSRMPAPQLQAYHDTGTGASVSDPFQMHSDSGKFHRNSFACAF